MTVATDKLPLTEAAHRLAGRVSGSSCGQPARIEVRVDQIDPLHWLAAQIGTNRVYWRDRSGACELAGIGCADIIESPDKIRKQLHRYQSGQSAEQVRYIGGMRFDPAYPEPDRDPSWAMFGTARFVLPRFELIRRDDQTSLVCNLTESDSEADRQKIAAKTIQSSLPCEPENSFGPPTSHEYSPDRTEWLPLVDRALELIASDRLRKLVLARRGSLTFDRAPSAWQLLDGLRANTSNCFLFGFGMEGAAAFVGASPERLYRREGRRIETEAIAGTRPRGDNPGDDKQLASELASSQKERWEQRLVVSGLEAGLKNICADCRISDTTAPLKLARLQHLKTRLEGRLKDGVDDAGILGALHPSPAVGGYPTENAAEQVRELEPFDRGWYAGPVGWIGHDRAEFAVGIRSALLLPNRLELFSGAGIVSGSDPGAEWDEVQSKIGPFLRLLGGAEK